MNNGKQESKESVINEKVTMDTRKFLSAINNSAQSQIAFYEDAVRRLGRQHGQEWTLTALQSNRIIFETAENEFMVANHERSKGGRVKISDIKKIDLREDKKPEKFADSCVALIEAIEGGDTKVIDAAYNKVAAGRFRSTAIPTNGIVKTKDGMIRHVAVDDASTLGERLVKFLSDQYTINESGGVEGVFIDEDFSGWNLGVTELTTRKLVARNMCEVARAAYQSPNFQTLVETVASLICKDNLEQAIEYSSKFLREHQEFCLLNKNQWSDLIGNALATKLCFNESLADDTATLMRKTNLKVNRNELVEAWRKTAERAQHPVMLENVDALSTSKNIIEFEGAYEQFLDTIFEATGETTRGALIAGLELLMQKVEKGDIDEPTSEELAETISNLKQKGDSASVWTAMETLDSVRRHVDDMKGLDDFDEMPGPMADDEVPAEEEGGLGGGGLGGDLGADADVSGGGDKPLEISIKMDPAKMAQSAMEPAGEEPLAEPEGGDKFDLDSLDDIDLEGDLEGGDGGEGEEDELSLAASKQNDAEPISEDTQLLGDFLGKEGIKEGEIVNEVEVNEDYATQQADFVYQVASESGQHNMDVVDRTTAMEIAQSGESVEIYLTPAQGGIPSGQPFVGMIFEGGRVVGTGLGSVETRNIEDAIASMTTDPMQNPDEISELFMMSPQPPIDSYGVDDDMYGLPSEVTGMEDVALNSDYETVTEELADTDVVEFGNSLENPDEQDPDALQASAEAWLRVAPGFSERISGIRDPRQQQQQVTDLAGELLAKRLRAREDGMAEDQHKSPLRQLSRRGLKKSAVDKLVKEGKFDWVDRDDKAVLGEFKGVKFVLDNSEEPLVILSENGKNQVPVPADMIPGALFFAELSEDEAEADAFVEWLSQTIESLRIDEATIEEKSTKETDAESSDEEAKDSKDDDSKDVAESESESDEPVSEECPEHLKAHQFKKKGESSDSDDGDDTETDDTETDDTETDDSEDDDS